MKKKTIARRPIRRAAKAAVKPAVRPAAKAAVKLPVKPAPRRPRRAATAIAEILEAPEVMTAPSELLIEETAPAPEAEEGLVPNPDPPFADPMPEREYAAREALPELDRPMPAGRRAVFFDVENTSHAPHIEHVLQRLDIDRVRSRTDFVAVGNWRVVGHEVGRLLARRGAQLVHSAPATGVRDWSDLRIAVSAGVWLATARPGDRIEIVSDDRAFDAVGDVATALGIEFPRLSYRALTGAPAAREPAEAAPAPAARSHFRSGRGRGRGRGRGEARPAHVAPVAPPPVERPHRTAPVPAPAAAAVAEEPHTAPHDEIIEVVRELLKRARDGRVLIDTVARELKARGFGRTPGSPRLITRLRRIKEIAVSQTGMITMADGTGGSAGHSRSAPISDAAPVSDDAPVSEAAPEPVATAPPSPPAFADEDEDDGPQPGNSLSSPPILPTRAPRGARRPHRRGGGGPRRATG
ncbi:MAG TPA: hypothetical protein VML54_08860 [Candidatus Limnocylindrales bacterium]|nr:hypothetical protein [Candidatus Limnocylindrales bacterium]